MGRVGIRFETRGIDEMIRALHEVAQPPNFEVTGLLEGVLADIFALTQARVHVISGRLKASGRPASHFDGKEWTGSIHYGGPQGTPAYYGIFEISRGGTRPDGTPHDFYSGLERFDQRFKEAIDQHFKDLG